MLHRTSRPRAALSRAAVFESLESRFLLTLVPAGSEFRVSSFTPDGQSLPAIASDSNGNFVVAWAGRGSDDPLGIYFQRYNSAGAAQGAATRVNVTTLPFLMTGPSVAMDADGDFVVVWPNSGATSGYDILARRYTAAGAPQGLPVMINQFTTGAQRDPSVAMSEAGDFTVAWESYGQDGSGYGIYARRFNAAGTSQGNEFRVNTFTTEFQSEPRIAMDDDGDMVVTWSGIGGVSSVSQHIYAQRLTATGALAGSEIPVSLLFAGGVKYAPSVAMDSDGDFAVSFTRINTYGTIQEVRARRYDAAGTAQGLDFRVNTFTGSVDASTVTMSDDGAFAVAWHSFEQDGSASGIYAQQYDAAGVRQDGEFRVNSYTTDSQSLPSISSDSNGDLVIGWQSLGQDGSGYGVYAQRYQQFGPPQVTGAEFRFETAPHRMRVTFDQDVSANLQSSDLLLENLTTLLNISPAALPLTYDPSTNTATFTYTGPGSGITGVLPDGDYRATILASGISGPGGALPFDHVFPFFFLNGDANRDGSVNSDDFNILATNFGQLGKNFSQGNFNYDAAGLVNSDDFNLLATNFGISVGTGHFSATRIAPARPPRVFDSLFDDLTGDGIE